MVSRTGLHWDNLPNVTQTVGTRRFRDTPRLLTLQSNVLAVLIVVWALTTIATLAFLRTAVVGARRAAEQVSRVQETSIQLSRADSLATSGFLKGGLQSDAALSAFAKDMRDANANLAVINRGTGGQGARSAIQAIGEYQADVTSAQANNRQGFPVGATYQKTASNFMRTDILGPLANVGQTARNELLTYSRRFQRASLIPTLFLLFVAVPVMLGLLGLSRRTKRTLNMPALLGLGLACIATVVAATLCKSTLDAGTNFVRGDFRRVDLVTQARVALYDAKSNEALTLIARGSGQSYELAWRQNMADLTSRLGTTPPEVQAYIDTHAKARQLDDSGDWDAARLLVLPTNNVDTSNPVFTEVDKRLAVERGTEVLSTNALSTNKLLAAQIIIGLAALAAAGLVRVGYRQRVREYQ